MAAHNPEIDWEKGEVKMMRCPPICGKRKQEEKKEVKKIEKNEDEETLRKLVPKRFWKWKKVFGKRESERIPVQKTWDHAIELKEGFTPKKGKVYSLSREERKEVKKIEKDEDEETLRKLVPKRFWKWKKVFGKRESERMPVRKAWDHTIELKKGFTPKKGKVYSLSREEREKVQAFVEDQLQKGYIQPSKSPQTSPVHFVAKKDGKRRMVQDYRHINQWMVKNGYPLPLIVDILDGVGKRKVFTKLDLRWGYNNVRIKETNGKQHSLCTLEHMNPQ